MMGDYDVFNNANAKAERLLLEKVREANERFRMALEERLWIANQKGMDCAVGPIEGDGPDDEGVLSIRQEFRLIVPGGEAPEGWILYKTSTARL